MAAQKGAHMMADAKDAEGENRPPKIRITVVIANRYTVDTELATGKQIKERADVPGGFSLYRRIRGGNEPISDDARSNCATATTSSPGRRGPPGHRGMTKKGLEMKLATLPARHFLGGAILYTG